MLKLKAWSVAIYTIRFFVNTAQTQLERELPLHRQLVYPAEDELKNLSKKTGPAYILNPSKSYPPGMGQITSFGKKSLVKEKTINLPINPNNGAVLRYTGDKRFSIEEDRPGKRYRQNGKSCKKCRGRKSGQKL